MHSVTCWLRSNTLVNCVVCLIPTVQHFPDADVRGMHPLDSRHAMQTCMYSGAAQSTPISEQGNFLQHLFKKLESARL